MRPLDSAPSSTRLSEKAITRAESWSMAGLLFVLYVAIAADTSSKRSTKRTALWPTESEAISVLRVPIWTAPAESSDAKTTIPTAIKRNANVTVRGFGVEAAERSYQACEDEIPCLSKGPLAKWLAS